MPLFTLIFKHPKVCVPLLQLNMPTAQHLSDYFWEMKVQEWIDSQIGYEHRHTCIWLRPGQRDPTMNTIHSQEIISWMMSRTKRNVKITSSTIIIISIVIKFVRHNYQLSLSMVLFVELYSNEALHFVCNEVNDKPRKLISNIDLGELKKLYVNHCGVWLIEGSYNDKQTCQI